MVQWARAPAVLTAGWPRWIATTLGLANVATFTAWLAPVFPQAVDAAQGGEVLEPYKGAGPVFAALVEIGFITNASDERELGSAQQRERIAVGLAGAIREFGRRFDARRGDQSAAAGSGREAGGKF